LKREFAAKQANFFLEDPGTELIATRWVGFDALGRDRERIPDTPSNLVIGARRIATDP
jgi:hypothetical protein